MDRQRKRTVRRFAERLREVVDESVSEAATISHQFANTDVTTARKKEEAVRQLGADIDQVEKTMKALTNISEVTPSTSQVMELGFATVSVIDEILDTFERRLQLEFGVSPVDVCSDEQQQPVVSFDEYGNGPETCGTNTGADMIVTPPALRSARAAISANSKAMFTPQTVGARTPGGLLGMSKTPRMEDFGLDVDLVRELREQSDSFLNGHGGRRRFDDENVRSRSYHTQQHGAMGDWRSEDLSRDVQQSMQNLGIETRQEMNDRYEKQRHVALQQVLQGCTPRLKSDRHARVDLTQLAAGYATSDVASGDARSGRELLFNDE